MNGEDERPLVLAVDDDDAILQVYRDLFADEGYRLLCWTYPAKDLEVVRSTSPDLVLLDLLFGQDDAGWRFLRRAKTDLRTANIPVVIVTADQRLIEDRRAEFARWTHQVVLKPFDIDDLFEAVASAVGH